MEQWHPDQHFLRFLRDTSPLADTPRFIVCGEKKTLSDLIREMEVGTAWGRNVYLPLYQAYSRQGPLHEEYRSGREQQSP